MPNYDYLCEACNHPFEAFAPYEDREKACEEKCSQCGEKKVIRIIGGFPGLAADTTLTPDKKTGGQWSEMMEKVKSGIPKQYHKNIDKSTNMSGKRWYG
jgi:putative FmdB family regulatory protein